MSYPSLWDVIERNVGQAQQMWEHGDRWPELVNKAAVQLFMEGEVYTKDAQRIRFAVIELRKYGYLTNTGEM